MRTLGAFVWFFSLAWIAIPVVSSAQINIPPTIPPTISELKNECHARGNQRACYQLERAQKQAENLEKAKPVYQKMCDSREMNGCIMLGILAQNEGKNAEARALFKKACDIGDDNACRLLKFHDQKQAK